MFRIHDLFLHNPWYWPVKNGQYPTACAVLAPSVTANALSKSAIRKQCQQQVNARYPTVNAEERRTVNDLMKACMKNGGKIPG
jgi:hypothetical protein